MPRVPAIQARKLLAAAVRECTNTSSLAQVIVAIIEAGHYETVIEHANQRQVRQAIQLVNRTTRIYIRERRNASG